MRVGIVATVRLYREGLAAALQRRPGIEVMGTAADDDAAVELVVGSEPTIALVDAELLLHTELASRLRAAVPATRIVAVGVLDDAPQIIACAERGVAGYALREAGIDELVAVLRAAERGEAVCTPAVAACLMRRLAELSSTIRAPDPTGSPLTVREHEIIALLEQGLMNKEIARRLGLSLSTVKNHVHNVLDKLGLASRAEVVRWRRTTLVGSPRTGRARSRISAGGRPPSWGCRSGDR
jgi:DNA-binding NarL/FixJ family response regulator